MREAFRDKLGLSKQNIEQLTTINNIVDEYRSAGYVLTLRQLYYQLVSRDIIRNDQKEYSKLSILLTKGRMAGVVDWSAIEDRGRQPHIPYYVNGVVDALTDTVDQYRIDRQKDQEYYVEVWVEKDALSNVFKRVTEPYHIRLMVNKGYSSTSAMYYSAKRFIYSRKPGVLLYFGDHDPSGKDMVRDIRERLCEMGADGYGLEVINPALTMDQINEYNPPENPAKIKDPRAKWYIEKYGNSSWELDALPPQVLTGIINNAITPYIDMDTFNEMRDKEAKQKAILRQFADNYDEDSEDDFDGDYNVDNSDMDFNG